MASCSAPIYDGDKFVGCVTCDLMLTEFTEYLASIKIGETGTVWLIDGAGTYVYHPAIETAAADGLSIDSSTEMGDWISQIKSKDSGTHGTFAWEGKTRILYWLTVPNMSWKLGLTIEENEIVSDINKMMYIIFGISIAAMAICALLIVLQANSIAKALRKVSEFA